MPGPIPTVLPEPGLCGHAQPAPQCLAIDEFELAARRGISVPAVCRWRKQPLGPNFRKFGARISCLITEVEAFERRVSRRQTFAHADP